MKERCPRRRLPVRESPGGGGAGNSDNREGRCVAAGNLHTGHGPQPGCRGRGAGAARHEQIEDVHAAMSYTTWVARAVTPSS